MARKNKTKQIKTNTFKVEVRDPGLGFSPALQQASMARTHSKKKLAQLDRRNTKIQLRRETW